MKKITIVLFILFAVNTISAQTEILKDNGSWLTLVSSTKLSEKLNFTFLTQQRRVGFLENTQGFLYTPSISYKLTNNVSVGAGYLFYRYYTEGALHASINRDENRLFQFIALNTKAGKFKISQRFMFEERVVDHINSNVSPNVIEGNTYVNRIRYRVQATTNLFKLKNEKYIMGKLSNEVRVRFRGGMAEPDFDQNNFEALLGYNVLSNSTIWVGYGRYYYKKNSTLYVLNNLLHVTLSYNFDITKKK